MSPPGGTPTPPPKVALMLFSTMLLRCMPIVAMPVVLLWLAWLLYPPPGPVPSRLSVCMLRWLIQLPSTIRLLPTVACWIMTYTRM